MLVPSVNYFFYLIGLWRFWEKTEYHDLIEISQITFVDFPGFKFYSRKFKINKSDLSMFLVQFQNIKGCVLQKVVFCGPLLLFFDFFSPPLRCEKEKKYCAAILSKYLIFPFVFMHHLIFNQSFQMPDFKKTKVNDHQNHLKK